MVPKNEKEKTLNRLPPEREKIFPSHAQHNPFDRHPRLHPLPLENPSRRLHLLDPAPPHQRLPSAAPTFPWPGTLVGSLGGAPLQPVHGFPGRGVAVVA